MRTTCGMKSASEHARVGIDVVDGAGVDAERGQQAAVLADAGQIFAGLQVVPEDGAAAVAALDGAIQVVPLVDPAHGSVGRLLLVELGDGFAEGDFSQEGEGAVEHAAIVGGGDHGVRDAADGRGGQPVAIQREVGGEVKLRRRSASVPRRMAGSLGRPDSTRRVRPSMPRMPRSNSSWADWATGDCGDR